MPVEPGSRLTEGTVSFLIALNVDMILVVGLISESSGSGRIAGIESKKREISSLELLPYLFKVRWFKNMYCISTTIFTHTLQG